MNRKLYLVAYDIGHPKRLKKMLDILKDYASGGQKSAFECYLSVSEKEKLLTRVRDAMNIEEDAVIIVRMLNRESVTTLGIAVSPLDLLYTYIG
jgi:CRISPR-associated protein Cas2